MTLENTFTNRADLVRELRRAFEAHLDVLALSNARTGSGQDLRNSIRLSHAEHRRDTLRTEARFIGRQLPLLIHHFAAGAEVVPERIDPVLIPVEGSGESARIFRLATALWSIPVSRGFGRRMRYLVKDATNDKLIGLFALGDPVFNLRARDAWIGWSVNDRKKRLVSLMDGYVVGAVPPYNQLLGGKLVTALIASREVSERFSARYSGSIGTISREAKTACLAAVTITSALGRSSVYNRLRLEGLLDLKLIGETSGYGHFHISAAVFAGMRRLLELDGHPYASGYRYGQGPSWRLRVIREALGRIGLKDDLLKHGITREIYAMALVPNFREYLQGKASTCIGTRPTAAEISAAALDRWIGPRAQRLPGALEWRRSDTEGLLRSALDIGQIDSEKTMERLPLAVEDMGVRGLEDLSAAGMAR